MVNDRRRPLSPAEYDAAKRELETRHPGCWHTSGYRSPTHNIAVGGDARSKHAILPCMADDYAAPTHHELQAMATTAFELGLWYVVHTVDKGGGIHLHIQGLAPGPIPADWSELHQGGGLT